MLSKTWYNLHIYIDEDYKTHDFSDLYCTRAGTHWLCQHRFATYFQWILLKSRDLSVVSDPRNVLRHKQGRLTLEKLEFLFRSMYNDGVLKIILCSATFHVQLKPHILN